MLGSDDYVDVHCGILFNAHCCNLFSFEKVKRAFLLYNPSLDKLGKLSRVLARFNFKKGFCNLVTAIKPDKKFITKLAIQQCREYLIWHNFFQFIDRDLED